MKLLIVLLVLALMLGVAVVIGDLLISIFGTVKPKRVLIPKRVLNSNEILSDNVKILIMNKNNGEIQETTVYYARNFLDRRNWEYIGRV